MFGRKRKAAVMDTKELTLRTASGERPDDERRLKTAALSLVSDCARQEDEEAKYDSAGAEVAIALATAPVYTPPRMPRGRQYIVRSRTLGTTYSNVRHEQPQRIKLNPYIAAKLSEHADKLIGRRILATPDSDLEDLLLLYCDDVRKVRRFIRGAPMTLLWCFVLLVWPIILSMAVSPFTEEWQNQVREKQFALWLGSLVHPRDKMMITYRLQDLGDIHFDHQKLVAASFYYQQRKAAVLNKALNPELMPYEELVQERYPEIFNKSTAAMRSSIVSAEAAEEFVKEYKSRLEHTDAASQEGNNLQEEFYTFAHYFASNGDRAQALALYDALSALQSKTDLKRDLLTTQHLIANCNRDLGRNDRAETLYKKLLDSWSHTSNSQSSMAMVEFDYAKLLVAMKRPQEAMVMEQAAWNICHRDR